MGVIVATSVVVAVGVLANIDPGWALSFTVMFTAPPTMVRRAPSECYCVRDAAERP